MIKMLYDYLYFYLFYYYYIILILQILIEICFEDLTFLEFYLQVKYYEKRKTFHLNWGRILNHFMVEVSKDETVNIFQYQVDQLKVH